MQRRHFLLACGSGACAALAHAQINDVFEAINKAGRQRMLTQRMGKAWLALALKTGGGSAQQVLDKSVALFEQQLAELKGYAPAGAIRDTYVAMENAWPAYRQALNPAMTNRESASKLMQLDAQMLALAHQGTQQYEASAGRPVGRLVNVAGRQRMLSQRMAKFYFAATLSVEASAARQEITKAREEFLQAAELLKKAPETTPRIAEELTLAEGQWVFFEMALQRQQDRDSSPKHLSDVFTASENLLTVMDRVTGLYSALKA